MGYIHEGSDNSPFVAERRRRMGNEVAAMAKAIATCIGTDNFVEAAERVDSLLEVIFDFSATVYDYDRPSDQWGLFCGAVSPQIEQVFSDLLYCSGVEYDDGKPVRSDGFVFTEDDRPC